MMNTVVIMITTSMLLMRIYKGTDNYDAYVDEDGTG